MPRKRFERLSEEKKQSIAAAACREFQRTGGKDLQIGRLTDDAGISRSTFYTYFEDKEDVCLLVMQQSWKEILEFNKRKLLECGGNYWRMQAEAIEGHLQRGKQDAGSRMLYLFLENEVLSEKLSFAEMREAEYRDYKQWIFQHMRKKKEAWTEDRFGVIQDLCQSASLICVQRFLRDAVNEKEAAEEFRRELAQLKQLCQK